MSIRPTRPTFLPAVLVALAIVAIAVLTTPSPLTAQDLPSIEDHTEGTTADGGLLQPLLG